VSGTNQSSLKLTGVRRLTRKVGHGVGDGPIGFDHCFGNCDASQPPPKASISNTLGG